MSLCLTSCKDKKLYSYAGSSFIAHQRHSDDIANLGQAILNQDNEAIQEVITSNRKISMDFGKYADTIKQEAEKGWFASWFSVISDLILEKGGEIGKAGYQALTQNWVGVATTLGGLALYYLERRKKQYFANALTDIACEKDENVRQDKLKKTFNKKKKET